MAFEMNSKGVIIYRMSQGLTLCPNVYPVRAVAELP